MSQIETPTDLYVMIGALLPNAVFDVDSSGEIIVATGFRFCGDGAEMTLEEVEVK